MVGVAQHLAAKGSTIAFCAPGDLAPQLQRAGLACPCFTTRATSSASEERVTRGSVFAEKVRDAAWLRRWIGMLLIEAAPAQVGPLREIVRDFKPDAMAIDPMVYAAVFVAESKKIPWAGISSSLNPVTPDDWICPLTETVRELAPSRQKLFTDHGVGCRFKVCDAISPWLNTVFTTEAYVPRALSGNDCSFHVGPSLPAGPRGDEEPMDWTRLRPDRPTIYMSLGSQIFYQPRLFQAVVEAIRPDEAQIILSLNDLLDEDFARSLPPHVIAVRYAPQLELLARVEVMINHGGANSVMECLSRGRPMLLLPICNDQHLQARFLERSGAGRALDPDTLTVEKCREALRAMLDSGSTERSRAAEIGKSYAANDGAGRAAELILELARTRQPISPT